MSGKFHIGNKLVFKYLNSMLANADIIPLDDTSKWVIFSDLHMGDGSSKDDFRQNAGMFQQVLQSQYLKNDFGLVLNGDVEELLRYPLQRIQSQWKDIFKLFDEFAEKNQLVKLAGNHDLEFLVNKNLEPKYKVREAVRFQYGNNFLNFFHSHQASKSFQRRNRLIGFILKYFANPLRIKNYSVAHDSVKQYKIEKRVYAYSSFRKEVSVIGHTHRPLFESMHKVERIKFKIEQLCREFSNKAPTTETENAIEELKRELKRYALSKNINPFDTYIYNSVFHVPCLFNSGCVIGKRGMTCLEIEGNKIRLVHWFDKNISKKYLLQGGYQPEQLGKTDFYRMVINEESLDYIFTRIKFLA